MSKEKNDNTFSQIKKKRKLKDLVKHIVLNLFLKIFFFENKRERARPASWGKGQREKETPG